MSIRNLKAMFNPASIALIGGSNRPNTLGAVVARNLFHSRFQGPVMPVHPTERAIEGVLAYPSVADLPLVPDLAVICDPTVDVPAVIHHLSQRGTRATVLIGAASARAVDSRGESIQKVRDAARPHLVRILGPNSHGLLVPGKGINASSLHADPIKGDIALVTQSGAILSSVLDWANERGIGFSHMVSLGGKADVDFGDCVDFLASDGNVRAILLYAEALSNARKFMSAARAAARQKPLIILKAGRSAEAAQATLSHTGALAGVDAVYDAAFQRAGILRVHELNELFDAAETLSMGLSTSAAQRMVGGRLAILTNGGGIGVMATDTLVRGGGLLAPLSEETIEKLDKVLPAGWSRCNPVDILNDAPGKRYEQALSILYEDAHVDGILVLNCPTAIGDTFWAAQAVVETISKAPQRRYIPVFTCWLGGSSAMEARKCFKAQRIPSYDTPSDAVTAFLHLSEYYRNQELLLETPTSVDDSFDVDDSVARNVIDQALSQGREWLTEVESKRVLAAYDIPVVETRFAESPDAAAAVATELGGSVVLKVISPDIIHKGEVGGAVLDLRDAERVHAEATRILGRLALKQPQARIQGFAVQRMAVTEAGEELILGMTEDALFGPVLLFGKGGASVEIVGDKALALPPLNLTLARDMMSRTKVWQLMKGYGARHPVAIEAVALALIKMSRLVIDFPEIVEMDINPLLATPDGVSALDARIRIAFPAMPGARRLAIRPYPRRLQEDVALRDGRKLLLRPIRPEDEPLIQGLFERLTPEDVRMRFFAPMRQMSHKFAARLTQIDYDREMALVAECVEDGAERGQIFGVVRISADPDNVKAEYAVTVQSSLKGQGLGSLLMRKIIQYARSRGIQELTGQVLRENHGMLHVCERFGFRRSASADDPDIMEVSLPLREVA